MIDLRSDTVTQPTAEMLDAMHAARLGDDSRDGDPTVRELEALAATRTGKQAAMFVPSGTLGNLAALMAHTGRGGEVLLEENSHILKSEMGAIAQVAGLFRRTLGGNLRQAGMLAAAGIVALERMVERLADDHRTAKQLADGLHRLAPGLVDPKSIETNIVRVDTTASGWPAETWSAALQRSN